MARPRRLWNAAQREIGALPLYLPFSFIVDTSSVSVTSVDVGLLFGRQFVVDTSSVSLSTFDVNTNRGQVVSVSGASVLVDVAEVGVILVQAVPAPYYFLHLMR